MKLILALMLTFATIACQANSIKRPNVLQIHYSPIGWAWGDSDDEFFQDETTYEHFNLTFNEAFTGRLILNNKYISYSQHYGFPDDSLTEEKQVTVESLSAGVALNLTFLEPEYNKYLIANFGLGTSNFHFHDQDIYDQEFFAEVGAEFGVKLIPNVLVGAGFSQKLFGYPGQTKADWLELYLSASVAF